MLEYKLFVRRMGAFWRNAPAVDATVRWWRGMIDARALLEQPAPDWAKRFLDERLVPALLGFGLERHLNLLKALPRLGDASAASALAFCAFLVVWETTHTGSKSFLWWHRPDLSCEWHARPVRHPARF